MAEPEKAHPSKISYLLYAPVALIILGFLVFAIIKGDILPIIIFSATGGLIFFPIMFNTKYTITGTTLNVKSGLVINIDIDIEKIKKITPNNTVWSAPALSFDRIEIFYNTYDSVVISPQNKKDFIETLKQINPAIVSEV